LSRFLLLMGKLFGFVSSDIKAKLDMLEEMRRNDTDGNLKTIKKMIAYEKEEGLLQKKGYVSGSRNVLRLHRGLGMKSLSLCRISICIVLIILLCRFYFAVSSKSW
jgi:Glycolipid transfer protein (GLTP)